MSRNRRLSVGSSPGRALSISEDEVLLNTLATQAENSLEQKRLSRKEARKSLLEDGNGTSQGSSKVSIASTFIEEIWDSSALEELPVRTRKRVEAMRDQTREIVKSKLENEQYARVLQYEMESLKNDVEELQNNELQLTFELRKAIDSLRNEQACSEKKDRENRELKVQYEEMFSRVEELEHLGGGDGVKVSSDGAREKELEVKCTELESKNARLQEQIVTMGMSSDKGGDMSTKLKLLEKHMGEKLTFYVRENVRLKQELQESESALQKLKSHDKISRELKNHTASQVSWSWARL